MPVATWPATSGAARTAVVRTSPRKCAGAWVGRDMGRRCVSRDCGRAPIGRRALAPGRGGRLCYRPSGKARDRFVVPEDSRMPDQDNAQRDAATPPPVPPAPASVRGTCGNCGSPLLGKYCHACGQPVTGMVRHFSTILGDFTDTILNWDARLPRTLWPLLARPAFLTREYFAGRRVRYVSPVRLFVTLAIVTFFVAQLMISFGGNVSFGNGAGANDVSFSQVETVEEVVRQRDEALAELGQARKENVDGPPGLDTGLGIAEQAIRNSAQARIRVLERRKANEAPASTASAESASAEVDGTAGATPGKNVDKEAGANSSEASPTGDDADTDTRTASEDEETLSFHGEPWDPVSNPLTVSWRTEEHTSELQSLMRISYSGFRLKKKNNTTIENNYVNNTHIINERIHD